MTTATDDRSQENVLPVAAFFANVVKRLFFVVPLAVVQIGVYWLLNHFLLRTSRELSLTWIDRSTPFMIWTIWAYFALIAMAVVLPLLVRNDGVFRRLLRAYIVAMVGAWLFYLFFPTHYPRPPQPQGDSWSTIAYRSLLEFDSPECSFPSSHVIVPILAALALRRDKSLGRWWPFLAAFVALCCLSILTTKQHFIWDLLGGAGAAAVGWWVSNLCRPIRMAKQKQA